MSTLLKPLALGLVLSLTAGLAQASDLVGLRHSHSFPRGTDPRAADRSHNHHHHHRPYYSRSSSWMGHGHHPLWRSSRSFTYSRGWPLSYWYSASYAPYYSSSYHYGYEPAYGIYYRPRDYYLDYYLPPVFAPAELLYGPQANNQFLGLPRQFGLPQARQRPVVNIGLVPAAVDAPAGAMDQGLMDDQPQVRRSNGPARERSRRFIQFGDNLFAQQRYHEALQRYKSAAKAAPDLAEPYFRQAHALVASGRYDLAQDPLARALTIGGADTVRDGFELDQLYGDSQMAKRAQLEAMAQHAFENPNDAGVLLLLGVTLFYDQQPERAITFLSSAAELSADQARLAAPFLTAASPDPAQLEDTAL